jgi:hypothetical protein
MKPNLLVNIGSTTPANIFCRSSVVILVSAAALVAEPCLAFTISSSSGDIEFSVRPVTTPNPPTRSYDAATTSTSVEGGLLTPGRGYPSISEASPDFPIQKKNGSIASPLSDIWNDPLNRGKANISLEAIAQPRLAGISWDAKGVFLDDLVEDNNSVRNASFGAASFTTTLASLYTEVAFLNVGGSIDLEATDSWVTGSLRGIFGGAASPNTLEIVFGFDGANRGRQDFITAFINGSEVSNFGSMKAGAKSFSTKGLLFSNDSSPLNVGDEVTIEGTFSCVAFNGQCETVKVGFDPHPVPEPLTIIGSILAIGFGGVLKLKSKNISSNTLVKQG